jgi:hypothetical protein
VSPGIVHDNWEEALNEATVSVEMQAKKLTDADKQEARDRILNELLNRKERGERYLVGSWFEIREELGLADISIVLFKQSCWHLRNGDRDPNKVRRIRVTRSEDKGPSVPRDYIISAF